MRESRSYGSVRGVAGDRYPFRDWFFSFGCRALGISQGQAGRSDFRRDCHRFPAFGNRLAVPAFCRLR